MNLIIDIGNSKIKTAFFENEELVSTSIVTENELSRMLLESWDGIIVSCVGKLPQLDFSKTLLLSASTQIPIQLNYKTPTTLGLDRIAAAVGANVVFPNENCLVIDLGTCINYELITKEGEYEGGIISPGYQMRLSAMNNFTAGLPLLTTVDRTVHTGKSTEECMQSGALNGLVYEIEGFIDHYRKQITDLKVVICGGDAKTFESKLKPTIFAQPNLVLIGLNRILETQNAK